MSLASAGVLLLGGIPNHSSLAPSIIFAVLYVILAAGWMYRICRQETRSTLMIRPGLFILARIITMAIRAHMSGGGDYPEGLFIAEIILLTVGLVLLIEPLIDCFGSQIYEFAPPPPSRFSKCFGGGNNASPPQKPVNRHWLGSVSKLLKLALLGILITGVLTGTNVSDAISDPNGSAAKSVKTYRLVNYILAAAVIALTMAATVLAQMQYSNVLEARKSFFIVGCGALLLVPSLYKLATTNHSDPAAFVHTSTAFFVLLITFEFIVCTLLLVFPITVMFPSERARRRWNEENIESGGRMQYQNPQVVYNQPTYAPRPSY